MRREERYQWKVGRMEHVAQSSDHRRVQYHEPDRVYRLKWKALNRVALVEPDELRPYSGRARSAEGFSGYKRMM